ncbi:MAG: sodium-dependent transporter [Muribaculaceae bacterium]|nr:sodium-dependent transporter [Muribaculaceae bacterium]
MATRGQFTTRIGAIAATVGSAVGLGNIWRFPYETGVHGGAAFIFIYLLCVLVMGIPVIVAEFVVGRRTHKNVCGALREMAPGRKFHWFSAVCIVASILIISFYSVVCGWILEYLFQAISGGLAGTSDYSKLFGDFVSSPYRGVMWTVLFLFANYLVLKRGLKRGIERMANVMMPLLFVLLVVFCVNSLMQPGAIEGIKFMFSPDFSAITPHVAIGAMGQAFFSLSLGLSCLLTYSSYFKDSDSLVKNAVSVALLDTMVAVLAGVMIFPAVFSYGMTPEAGPKLIFEVLPAIFGQMPGGYVLAILFFFLLFMASITSTISMSEISIAYFSEELKLNRNKASLLNTVIAMVLGTLCALSFGVMSDFKIFGMTLFDLFDYMSSNILLPLGGIFFSVLVGWVVDKKIVADELSNHGKLKVGVLKPLRFCLRYVAPFTIVLVFLYGLGVFEFLK